MHVGMQLTAVAIKLLFQSLHIQVELWRQAEDGEVTSLPGGLNLATRRTKWLSVSDGLPAGPAICRRTYFFNYLHRAGQTQARYAENDDPQPQDLVEWGLMKLNPCRISVSS